MAADVARWKRSNIKCYASAFSNILIDEQPPIPKSYLER